jgi:hypothetical protein
MNTKIPIKIRLFILLLPFIASACNIEWNNDENDDDSYNLEGTEWYNETTKEYLFFTNKEYVEDGGYGFNRGYEVKNNLALYNYYPNSKRFFEQLDNHICVFISSYSENVIYNYSIDSYSSFMRVFQYEGGKMYFSNGVLYFEASYKDSDGELCKGYQAFKKKKY